MQPQYTRIYETIVGSHAYGMNTPTSDVDKKGVCIPHINHLLGLHPFEQHEINKDYTIFSLRKFVALAADCNPNIIEMLATDPKDILFMDHNGVKLRDSLPLFISRKAKHTFSGYAFSQLQRIKNHQKWLNNPQVPPKREDFIVQKVIMLAEGGTRKVEKFLEKDYDAAYNKYVQYETWKRERNKERAALEASCGYDSKHGAHLLRLLRMGKEILTEGKVLVKRPDREELLEVRRGNKPYEDLVKEAEDLMAQLDALYETSPLPKTADHDKIETLLIDMQKDFYNVR